MGSIIAILNRIFGHYCYCNSSEHYCQCLESDLTKNFNNVHEANNDAHEKSKGIILEPRDNISTVSQRPIAVKVPDKQVFYILYIDK